MVAVTQQQQQKQAAAVKTTVAVATQTLDMVGGEELSLYGSTPNNYESQKIFLFAVRDSFTNVGPLKDFSFGLRINADAIASRIAKSETEKGLENCMQGCGGKKTEPRYKNCTFEI